MQLVIYEYKSIEYKSIRVLLFILALLYTLLHRLYVFFISPYNSKSVQLVYLLCNSYCCYAVFFG